jgi:hypothetical protein
MTISGQRLPLSPVYLNLLQTRPVNPVAPAPRVTAPPQSAPASATSAAAPSGSPSRTLPRGRFVDLLV